MLYFILLYVGRERFEAPEALFNPSLIDCEKGGMATMVFDMIQVTKIIILFYNDLDMMDICFRLHLFKRYIFIIVIINYYLC